MPCLWSCRQGVSSSLFLNPLPFGSTPRSRHRTIPRLGDEVPRVLQPVPLLRPSPLVSALPGRSLSAAFSSHQVRLSLLRNCSSIPRLRRNLVYTVKICPSYRFKLVLVIRKYQEWKTRVGFGAEFCLVPFVVEKLDLDWYSGI